MSVQCTKLLFFIFIWPFSNFNKMLCTLNEKCLESLVVSVILTNIKNKYNFLLIIVMNTIGTKIKYYCIKRHNTIIRQCSQHKRIS